MNTRELTIALSGLEGFSARSILKILRLNNLKSSSQTVEGGVKYPCDIKEKLKIDSEFISKKAKEIIEVCQSCGASIVLFYDKSYPRQLREIPDFPPVLFCRGNTKILNKQSVIAVVGSRRPSPYGLFQTSKIIGDLSRYFVIVSGLAVGIDSAVHQACLKSNGETIAVLGTPIDKIYPSSNERLADQIVKSGGLIISEYPPRFTTGKYSFPLRNRIIAGLSRAVLVMEAAKNSGSLITASLALDYNREVFALPGNVDSRLSEGTNQLIKDGANIFLNSQDVLDGLNIDSVDRASVQKNRLNSSCKNIIEVLGSGALQFDKIQNLTKIDVATLNGELVDLEIRRIISRRADGSYGLLTD